MISLGEIVPARVTPAAVARAPVAYCTRLPAAPLFYLYPFLDGPYLALWYALEAQVGSKHVATFQCIEDTTGLLRCRRHSVGASPGWRYPLRNIAGEPHGGYMARFEVSMEEVGELDHIAVHRELTLHVWDPLPAHLDNPMSWTRLAKGHSVGSERVSCSQYGLGPIGIGGVHVLLRRTTPEQVANLMMELGVGNLMMMEFGRLTRDLDVRIDR